jgi:serine/threonine protein kinase
MGSATSRSTLASEGPGTVIGHYKLPQKIGEGGMGTMYMAEQQEPVRRKVAVKIVKLGMDAKQIIARFESERQALAMMDHVNIARVFDAGATETGRPYFVMELIKSLPVAEYCDRYRLTKWPDTRVVFGPAASSDLLISGNLSGSRHSLRPRRSLR